MRIDTEDVRLVPIDGASDMEELTQRIEAALDGHQVNSTHYVWLCDVKIVSNPNGTFSALVILEESEHGLS